MKRVGFLRDTLVNGHAPVRGGSILQVEDKAAAEMLARLDGTLDMTPRGTADAYGINPGETATTLRPVVCPACRGVARMTTCRTCDDVKIVFTV